MNIVDFWSKQVEIWNDEKKCDFCWSFGAPLQNSAINVFQPNKGDECCVQVFLTNLKTSQKLTYNNNTGFINGKACDWNFNLHVLLPSQLGTNNYNEIKNHPVDESNWDKIFSPIIDCFGCDAMLDSCSILGYFVDITSWSAETVHYYQDMNYNGWKFNITFRERM